MINVCYTLDISHIINFFAHTKSSTHCIYFIYPRYFWCFTLPTHRTYLPIIFYTPHMWDTPFTLLPCLYVYTWCWNGVRVVWVSTRALEAHGSKLILTTLVHTHSTKNWRSMCNLLVFIISSDVTCNCVSFVVVSNNSYHAIYVSSSTFINISHFASHGCWRYRIYNFQEYPYLQYWSFYVLTRTLWITYLKRGDRMLKIQLNVQKASQKRFADGLKAP